MGGQGSGRYPKGSGVSKAGIGKHGGDDSTGTYKGKSTTTKKELLSKIGVQFENKNVSIAGGELLVDVHNLAENIKNGKVSSKDMEDYVKNGIAKIKENQSTLDELTQVEINKAKEFKAIREKSTYTKEEYDQAFVASEHATNARVVMEDAYNAEYNLFKSSIGGHPDRAEEILSEEHGNKKDFLNAISGNIISTDERFTDLDSELNQKEGGHWGAANSDNSYAISFAAVNSGSFTPIDYIGTGKEYKGYATITSVKGALEERNYAQNEIQKFSKEDYPTLYRGMSLSDKDLNDIISSNEIELTGCSAFSFDKTVADNYTSSSWTKTFGSDKKAVLFELERDDDVDNSIGMWHPNKDNKNEPAFEVLSGLSKVKIKSYEIDKNGVYHFKIRSNK